MGRVLVVQGEPALLDALRGELEARGHEIETCGGNVEAIQHVRRRGVDVVITDPSTRISEDLALAEELRATRPGIRIIVRTPAAGPDEVIIALRAHVFACFTAGAPPGEIVDMTRSALAAGPGSDDIEVISGLPHWLTLRVSCGLLTAERLTRFLSEFETTLPEGDRDLLITAFREMLLNAMEHGGRFDADRVVEVTAARTARAIVYHFKDPGAGFDEASAAPVAVSDAPEDVIAAMLKREELGLRPGGLGLLIVRQIVDELVYNERRNEAILIKHTD
jgi:anti-sigma regulatory factor (Ser/Thr protein kinase)/CheY-like chemotaxis protein